MRGRARQRACAAAQPPIQVPSRSATSSHDSPLNRLKPMAATNKSSRVAPVKPRNRSSGALVTSPSMPPACIGRATCRLCRRSASRLLLASSSARNPEQAIQKVRRSPLPVDSMRR
jgi:hypothetical protein